MRYHTKWDSDKKLRYEFDGSEKIHFSYSQAMQDLFILSLTKGKRNGTYLEIGCNVPDYTNNTYLISQKYNWSGLSIDMLSDLAYAWATLRPNDYFMCCNALTVDYDKIMQERYGENHIIDYLQLDIDPSEVTLKALKRLPMDKYRFGIITYETDVYLGNQASQKESRSILSDLGYTLIVGDVISPGPGGEGPFEDWWVDMNLIDKNIANDIRERGVTFPRNIFLL